MSGRPRGRRECARVRARERPRAGPAADRTCRLSSFPDVFEREISLPPYTTLADSETLDGGLVDLDAEAGAVGQGDQAAFERQRLAHDVLGQIEVREADAPVG